MHGAGNDYVYIDARGQVRDWPSLAVAMSDRHTGVGSDGIILMADSDRAHLRMRMYNADGSQGEMCGNGIRCLVKFALDRRVVPCDASPVTVETLAGVRQVTPVWEDGRMVGASVTMGEPRLRPQDVPVAAPGSGPVMDHPLRVNGYDLSISCVSMGNPHAVAFLREPVDDFPLHEVGPVIERHELFPERVNFEIVNLESRSRLRARVWGARVRAHDGVRLGGRRPRRGRPAPRIRRRRRHRLAARRRPGGQLGRVGRSRARRPGPRGIPGRVARPGWLTIPQKHCWTAVGAAPGANTPLGTIKWLTKPKSIA